MGKKQPTHEIKLGSIRATIWANDTEDRETWFNVTISRLYKSNDEWKDTTSFRRDDLPIVVKALDMAYSWIWRKQRQIQKAEGTTTGQALANSWR